MNLGLRAAAKELGISHVALLKAVKVGRVKREADGSFDVEAVRTQLERNSNPGKQKSARAQQRSEPKPNSEAKPENPGVTDYNEACRRLEWLKVEERELILARKRGEMVQLGQINAYIAGMIIRSRDILLRIGPELRDRLAQEKDPVRCEELVMSEIYRALRELAKYEPPEN